MRGKLTKKVIVGFTLILEGQSTIGDVVQVLQPFEEGYSHTTSVDVQVRNNHNVPIDENFVSSGCSWSISSLTDDFSLDLMCVALVDNLLNSGRHKDIALLKHKRITFNLLGTGETIDGTGCEAVVFQLLGVNTIGVVDGTIMLNDTNAFATSTVEVTHGVQTDITETLNNESLAFPAGSGTNHVCVCLILDEVIKPVEDTATSGGHTTVDTTLVNGLAGNASV